MAGQTVNPIQADEAAIILAYAHLVIGVPGDGMAVAQAQHAVRQQAGLGEKAQCFLLLGEYDNARRDRGVKAVAVFITVNLQDRQPRGSA